MFNQLSIAGIKKITKTAKLSRVTIITGPNEAGKSALLEGIRLAIQGKCSIGGGRLVHRIMSGRAAHSLLVSPSGQREWQGKVNEAGAVSSKCFGEDMQGGMPISVEEWDGLSNAEKFSLVAGNELCDVVADIERTKAKLKEQKAIVSTPSLPQPEPYDGDPVHALEEKLNAINIELHRQRQCSDPQIAAARKREQERLKEAQSQLASQRVIAEGAEKEKASLAKKLAFAEDMLSRYKEAISNEPKLVAWGREKKLTSAGLARHILDELIKACQWLSSSGPVTHQSIELSRLAEELSKHYIAGTEPIPRPVFPRCDELYKITDNPQAHYDNIKAKAGVADKELGEAKRALDICIRTVERIEQSLATELAIYGEPLPPESLLALTEEKEFLEQQLQLCKQWDSWGESVGRQMVSRTQAQELVEELEEKLEKLNAKRAAIVSGVTAGIEAHANGTLSRAGMPPITITVEATAKQASLVISRDGVHVDALAKSRRLVCSIAALSAMQQASNATCPVLVAECAEMDMDTLGKLLAALKPDKGNIILEHHTIPDTAPVDVVCIRMEK